MGSAARQPVTVKTKTERLGSVGHRLRQAREAKEFSQDKVAEYVGLQRSAAAQWERGKSIPSVETIEKIAELLEVRPEFIAFGRTDEPVVVEPDPDDLGYVLVQEVTFGSTADHRNERSRWGLPTDWLRQELGVSDVKAAILYKIETDSNDYHSGDRVIIDTSAVRPSPPGMFLYWDGFGPALGRITPIPQAQTSGKTKLVLKVEPHYGGSMEVEMDRLQIIGRVKGRLGRS